MTYEIAKVTQRTCVPERELAGDAVDGDDEPESEHLLRVGPCIRSFVNCV